MRGAPTDYGSIIPSVKATLFLVGAAFELLGIMLIAAPDLVPFARWLSVRGRRVEGRVRRALRLPGRPHYVNVEAAVSLGMAVSASLVVNHNPDAPIESKVEYLLRRDTAAQEAANALTRRVETLETESAKRLDDLRSEIEARIPREIADAQEYYGPARIVGTLALAFGLALTTWANFT